MKALIVCKHEKDSENPILKELSNKGIKASYAWKNTLVKSDLKGMDLVISIGGDGTTLSASHYLLTTPILAVNSSPNTSEGALTTINISKLNEKLDEILLQKSKIEKLERIELSINNKPLDILALNDIFIANEKAYLISKYKIKFKSIDETQKSSGLIFSTGTGSTAWFKSALGSPFSPQSKYIKMIVREPYLGNLAKFSLLKATINKNEAIEIIPLTNSILAIDSIREFRLKPNDSIKIKISDYPLLRIK